MPLRPTLACSLSLASLLVLCACDSPPPPACASDDECAGAATCVDGECVAPMDGGSRDSGPDAGGGADDAGPDAAGSCESALVCGAPPVCCAVGDECLDGACVPGCESGVRCAGACCGDAQVCVSDTCADLGGDCTDSYDCEAGQFCEPTLGRCLPQFDPVTCQVEPSFETFDPALEWSATEFTEEPDYFRSTVMPVVIDLDGDRLPEVVASFFYGGSGTGPGECRGVLRALNGRTGAEIWTVSDVQGSQITACSSHAAADLDGDGSPEILSLRHDGRVVALDAAGAVVWLSTTAAGDPFSVGVWQTHANSAIAVADLVPGGGPEIALGGVVLDASGVHLFSTPAGIAEGENDGYNGGLPLIADVNIDGVPDLVTGRSAWSNAGALLWTATDAGGAMTSDGYPAVGNFDDDPQPEVVLVSFGTVRLIDGLDGTVQWGPIAVPGGGRGGPPTVADFDGDGAPEIGVAGANFYAVFDPEEADGVLWQQPTQDASSNATGSAVFDFEGDGAAEVVYGDECYVRAYRGATGEELFALPNPSGTQHEYPVTADIDGDGNTEIAVVANGIRGATEFRGCELNAGWDAAERAGLFVYGSATDRWVRTRRVWNQHTYHVTHTTPAGAVVAPEPNNWAQPGLNNFRQNVQGEGVFNAPDLYVAGLSVSLRGCPQLVLSALIGNEGNLGVPAGVPVTFREGTLAAPGAVLGVELTTEPLLPGATTLVELTVSPTGEPPYAFTVEVDEDDAGASTVLECDEGDNDAAIADLDCDILR